MQVTQEVYQGILGAEAKVGAIHAGLECGLLGEKFPGMDMVSEGLECGLLGEKFPGMDMVSEGLMYARGLRFGQRTPLPRPPAPLR